MQRQLLEDLHRHFSKMQNPTKHEKDLLTRIEIELPYFQITSIHKDDLEHAGFDASKVSDGDMEDIAKKLADDYCEQLFWIALPIIAECYNVPKAGTPFCPKCEKYTVEYDSKEKIHYCTTCDQEWGDSYVLVKHPEDSTYFERKEIGYPCFNSEDNGARYVPEYEYILHFKKDPETDQYFKPVLLA